MQSCRLSPPRCLQWISISKLMLIILITISHSITHGQIQHDEDEITNLDESFVPSFGPHDTRSINSKRAIHNGIGGGFGFDNGDLQSNYMDLFDWNKEMPVQEIVNTFLDNEEELPVLKEFADSCPKREFFYAGNPAHISVVMRIGNLLMEQTSAQDAINMAGSLRDKEEVNVNAWLRGVIVASMFRTDLRGLRRPPMIEVMPSMFMNKQALRNMKRQANYGPQSRTCVILDGSQGTDNGVENILWYWREDVMLNSHHWFWHLTYPLVSDLPRADRRGELFYFMHHTFLARYHAERLSNNLAPVLPLNLQRGTILREAYNPHLTDTNSGNDWSPRPANIQISDTMSTAIPSGPVFVSIDNRTVEQNRVLESIVFRSLLSQFGGEVSIANAQGIDILGDTVEANEFSINPPYYGYHGVHNTGHVLISLVNDPVQQLGIPPGVMGDPGTAMRDIIFYPYHTFIDDIFDAHKRTLQPYQLTGGDWPLVFPGVEITSFKIKSYDLPVNSLRTFFGERRYDLSRGLDFNRSAIQGPIWTCVRHLDHQDFEYQLTINRKEFARSSKATVRLFLAPKFNEKGIRYALDEQRRRFFILDKFTVSLTPGKNTIVRKSADSSLTIDFPQSYRELQNDPNLLTPFCGCGWPHHLLLPQGTPQGMAYDMFVMVTNGQQDFVRQTGQPQVCRSAPIFCGIPGERYPDARPMNYPFDRSIYKSNNINPFDPTFDDVGGPITIEEWISEVPNMAVAPVTITHTNGFQSTFPATQFAEPQGHFDGQVNGLGTLGPAQAGPEFGAPTDFFKEFFPSTRPASNHPKQFAPEIEPPTKEFLNFINHNK